MLSGVYERKKKSGMRNAAQKAQEIERKCLKRQKKLDHRNLCLYCCLCFICHFQNIILFLSYLIFTMGFILIFQMKAMNTSGLYAHGRNMHELWTQTIQSFNFVFHGQWELFLSVRVHLIFTLATHSTGPCL